MVEHLHAVQAERLRGRGREDQMAMGFSPKPGISPEPRRRLGSDSVRQEWS